MRALILTAVLWPGAALAWEPLTGPAITEALSGRSVIFDPLTFQTFHATGLTDFVTERDSTGRWEVREDRYCSSWPPSGTWTCYGVEREGDLIRFIGPDGSASEGRIEG